MTFHFDEDTHRYRLEDGRIIPGHTRVLDLGGLVPYKAIEPDILERKAAVGREAHLACLMNDQGKRFTFDPRVQGYLEAWQDFRRKSGFTPTLCEYRDVYCINGLWFGMQIDRIGYFPGKKRQVVNEIKICSRIYAHHGVQLAAQAAGVQHETLTTPLARFLERERIVTQLRENGTWKIHPFEERSDYDAYMSCLHIAHWKEVHAEIYDGNGETAASF